MPTNPRSKLDRRIRVIVRPFSVRVGGVLTEQPVVHDAIHWAAKPANVGTFAVTDHGIQVEAETTFVVRHFEARQNGPGSPAVQPFPASTNFLVVTEDDVQHFVTRVTERGRRRFLELAIDLVASGFIQGDITYADGVPAGS